MCTFWCVDCSIREFVFNDRYFLYSETTMDVMLTLVSVNVCPYG